jgi:hypothetical protein
MKNSFKLALLSAAIFAVSASTVLAQEKKTVGQAVGGAAKDVGHATATGAKEVGHATATGAKAVGKKTSELAAKGAAAVVDKKYAGKGGPNKEIVYIDSKSRYYYVNKSGNRIFITEAEMTVRPNNYH